MDEAHNLADRAREMLSAELSGPRLRELRRQVVSFEGKESPMAQLMARLLRALRCTEDAEPEALADPPEAILAAAKEFAEAAAELESAEPDVREFIFDAQWFINVSRRFHEDSYRAMLTPEDGLYTLRLWCFDPSKHLKKALSRTGGAALFSATLAPMGFYAAQLGADGEEDAGLQLESPFPRENLKVFRLPVSLALRERERTKHAVAQVIHAMADRKSVV